MLILLGYIIYANILGWWIIYNNPNIILHKVLTHCFKLPKLLAIISQLIHTLLGVCKWWAMHISWVDPLPTFLKSLLETHWLWNVKIFFYNCKFKCNTAHSSVLWEMQMNIEKYTFYWIFFWFLVELRFRIIYN